METVSTTSCSNGSIDNESKQTATRTEIKRPSRFNDCAVTKKVKKGKDTNKRAAGLPLRDRVDEVTVNFIEGGINMNMAVTDEENREFDAREKANGEVQVPDQMQATDTEGPSDDSEDEDEQNEGMNNSSNVNIGVPKMVRNQSSCLEQTEEMSDVVVERVLDRGSGNQ